jgi:hypothetical protein
MSLATTESLIWASPQGWSVLVLGRAGVINNVEELLTVLDVEHRPWVRARGGHVIRISAQRITGRRLVLDPPEGGG